MSNYFFPIVKKTTTPFNPYTSSITTRPCTTNGYPTSLFTGKSRYCDAPAEVLYSIYYLYQNISPYNTTPNILNTYDAEHTAYSDYYGPKNITIIRHGEKGSEIYHLDLNGAYRACNMADYLNYLAQSGNPISYIITCNPSPYNTYPSMRPQQTIMAASFLLNIPMFIFSGSYDPSGVTAQQIFDASSGNPFNGLNILICWEHGNIQQLCLNLGCAALQAGRIPTSNIGPSATVPSYNGIYNFFYNSGIQTSSNSTCPNGNFDTSSNYYSPSPINLGPPSYAQQVIGPLDITDHIFKYMPYWNTYDFDQQLNLLFDGSSNLTFTMTQEANSLNTCYASCNIQIGMYQYPSNQTATIHYIGETSCETPHT
jgi:hypothetical protein